MTQPAFDEPTRRAIAAALNNVQRREYDFDTGTISPDRTGQWLKVTDVAKALGIGLDNIGFIEKGA